MAQGLPMPIASDRYSSAVNGFGKVSKRNLYKILVDRKHFGRSLAYTVNWIQLNDEIFQSTD